MCNFYSGGALAFLPPSNTACILYCNILPIDHNVQLGKYLHRRL